MCLAVVGLKKRTAKVTLDAVRFISSFLHFQVRCGEAIKGSKIKQNGSIEAKMSATVDLEQNFRSNLALASN